MWLAPSYIDVPMPRFVGGGNGAVRHQADQDLAALSAQGALRLSGARCGGLLGRRHGAGPIRWARRSGPASTSGKPFLRTPKCARSCPLHPGAAGDVAGGHAFFTLLVMAMISMGFDRGFQDPGGDHVDGDAGHPELFPTPPPWSRPRSAPAPTRATWNLPRPRRRPTLSPAVCGDKSPGNPAAAKVPPHLINLDTLIHG